MIKQAVKAVLPAPTLAAARDVRDIVLAEPEWRLSEKGQRSRARLEQLRDSHRGERCFILGNGPSLQRTDLTRLRNEFTFGLNRIYLLFEALGFHTTFLAAENEHVVRQFACDILTTTCQVFMSWRCRRLVPMAPNLAFFRTRAPGGFNGDALKPIREGATVTFIAMQLAYHMGFRDVILVGVDHHFVTSGPPGAVVTSQGADPNHFDPRYFGRGIRWELPDLDHSELNYHVAKAAYESDGRQIRDATIGGKLTVFPKVDYDSLFA